MKTKKHPYSKVIHYATGGSINYTKNIVKFTTLCGRIFKQGHDKIMQSGMIGAENTTCLYCKRKLRK